MTKEAKLYVFLIASIVAPAVASAITGATAPIIFATGVAYVFIIWRLFFV